MSAPLLGAITSGADRRVTLLAALSVFVLGNAATALAGTFGFVLGARIVTAVGAGLIGAAAFSSAVAMTPPDRRGQALALVMGGLTVSIALGLPAGTLIGAADWRLTLWAVAVAGVGLVAAAGIARSLPPIVLPQDTLRARLAPLREAWVQGVLAVTVTALAGTHLLYTYIAPALVSATGSSRTALTVVLLAWGLGNVMGNAAAGRLSDRYPAERVVLAGLAAATVLLAIGPFAVGTLVTAIGWAALWGVCVSLPVVPQQHRLVTRAPSSSAVLLGLNSSAIYLGIAIGGALGGTALSLGASPAWLGLPAATVTALGLCLAAVAVRHGRSAARTDTASC